VPQCLVLQLGQPLRHRGRGQQLGIEHVK
jgi:hypothetical protein